MKENKQRKSGLSRMSACLVLLILNTLLITSCASGEIDKQISRYTADLPFRMPEIITPSFPNHKVNIIDYGAVGDGHTKNTDAFASAIQACAEAGGGRVVIPPGIWLTGSIKLQSNINLHVEKGAVILFSGQFDDYPLIQTSWEGLPGVRCISPIYGINLENIAITGEGIIDGSGDAWRPVKKFKMTERQWKILLASGGVVNKKGSIWWPSEQALNGAKLIEALSKRDDVTLEDYAAAREFLRPVMVALVQCKNVLLDGPTFQNSPAWNIHPLMCEDVVIRNITVRNPWYSQNGDGLDIESCRNVVVYNCRFDVGDDAICLKSGKNEYGRLRGKPSENIAIADCIVYHGHGGVVIGSEMSGDVRKVTISNCVFDGTDRGIRIKSMRGRGGIVEEIRVSNIVVKNIKLEAIKLNMEYNETPNEPVSERTPRFRNIHISNVIASETKQAGLLLGLDEMSIDNVTFNNINIDAEKGFECINVNNLEFHNLTVNDTKGPVLKAENVNNLEIEGVKTLTPNSKTPTVVLINVSNVFVHDANPLPGTEKYLSVSGKQCDNTVVSGNNFHNVKTAVTISRDVPKGAVIEE